MPFYTTKSHHFCQDRLETNEGKAPKRECDDLAEAARQEAAVSKNDLFAKTGSGQTWGNALKKSMFFSGGETAESTHGPALAMSFTQPLVRNQFSLIELNCDDAVQGAFLGVVCLYSFPWNEAEQEVNFARTGSGHT